MPSRVIRACPTSPYKTRRALVGAVRGTRLRAPDCVSVAALALLATAARGADSAPGPATVTVRAEPVAAHYRAYARVEPVSLLPVRAAAAGVVVALSAVPGTAVKAGQTLAELGGAEFEASLTAREGAVRSARARLAAAKRSLAAERQQLGAQLSTQQAVAKAQSESSAAAAALDAARAQLRAARQMRTLTAPSAGKVVSIDAAQGERVTAGERLLTLQPRGALWLKAAYYGADAAAIHVGMTGEFQRASGGDAVRVEVSTVFASVDPDGAQAVALMPAEAAGSAGSSGAGGSPASTTPARWIDGEFGVVTLEGPKRELIAVPTRALILDHAQWWVMVRTPKGDRRQAVLPGPARGWQTFVERGLQPGQQVVAEDAYLEFHSAIAQRYQPPD